MCRPRAPAVAAIHGAGRQQDLSSQPAALRNHCSPTVPSHFPLPRVPRVPSAPPAPAARFHTCSPRRAPSPSPAATPCDSRYCRDHRSRAGVARQVPASAQAPLQRWAGSGAGSRRGAGLALGRGWGGAWGGAGRPAGLSRHLVAGECLHGACLAQVPAESGCARRASEQQPPDVSSSALGKNRPWRVGGHGRRDTSTGVPPGLRCGSARGAEAWFWPGRRGGRSRREAWGGGFGEGERGTSEELLPSLIAT